MSFGSAHPKPASDTDSISGSRAGLLSLDIDKFGTASSVRPASAFSGRDNPQSNGRSSLTSPYPSAANLGKLSLPLDTMSLSPDRMRDVSEVETTVISERQVKWDKEAAEADSKQAELYHSQWNLIREQISTFSRELVAIRTELKNMKGLEGRCAELAMKTDKHADILTELIDEPRVRKETDERLYAEFRETYKAITEALSQESKDRISGDEELLRSLGNARTMIEKETRDRTLANDENLIKVQALAEGLAQERQDREAGDTALRTQVQANRQEIVDEKAQREAEEAGLKRGIQNLESVISQQVKDIRSILEEEANTRDAADVRLSKGGDDVRRALESEADKLARLTDDVQKRLNDLYSALEKEAKERAGEDAALGSAVKTVKDMNEAERADRERGVMEIDRRLMALNEMLAKEAKERTLTDEEIKKELAALRAMLENEAKLRAGSDKELNDMLHGKHAQLAADHENTTRGIHGGIHNVEQELEGLKNALRQEAQDRSAADENLSRMEPRLKSDMVAEMNARKDGDDRIVFDLREGLRQISEALGQETKDRIAGDDDGGRNIMQLKAFLDKEVKDRLAGGEDNAGKMKDILGAIEQERGERENGDAGLRGQLAACMRDLASEKSERADEESGLKRALQALDVAFVKQLNDLSTKVDGEAVDRNTMIQKLEAANSDLHKLLANEGATRAAADTELEKVSRQLRGDLEMEGKARVAGDEATKEAVKNEARDRAAGDDNVVKTLNQAMLKVESALEGSGNSLQREVAERKAGDEDLKQLLGAVRGDLEMEAGLRKESDDRLGGQLKETMKQLSEALMAESKDRNAALEGLGGGAKELRGIIEKEMRDRRGGDEELAKGFQDLLAALDKEKADRERADLDLRNATLGNKQEIEKERGERTEEIAALKRGLQGLDQKFTPKVEELASALKSEGNERAGADKFLEKAINDLKGALDAEVGARGNVHDEVDKALRTLRSGIDQEAKARANDLGAHRGALEAEANQRAANDDALLNRINGMGAKFESGVEELRDLLKGEFAFMSSRAGELKFADLRAIQ